MTHMEESLLTVGNIFGTVRDNMPIPLTHIHSLSIWLQPTNVSIMENVQKVLEGTLVARRPSKGSHLCHSGHAKRLVWDPQHLQKRTACNLGGTGREMIMCGSLMGLRFQNPNNALFNASSRLYIDLMV